MYKIVCNPFFLKNYIYLKHVNIKPMFVVCSKLVNFPLRSWNKWQILFDFTAGIPGGFYMRRCIFYIFVPIDKITEKNPIRQRWIYYWCVFSPCSMLCNRVSRLFPPLFMAIRGMVGYRREWSGRRIHRAQMLAQLQRWGDTRVKGSR